MQAVYHIERHLLKREFLILIFYFLLYTLFHIIIPEHPVFYWFSLIILPFGVIIYFRKRFLVYPTSKLNLAFVGLKKGNLKSGIYLGIFTGIIYSIIQYFFVYDNFSMKLSPASIYKIPIAFILVAVTTGITNEFFFRGLLMTRLNKIMNSKIRSIILISIFCCIYNFVLITFDSQNLFVDGLYSILGYSIHGFLTGILLGAIYILSDHNLISAIIGHIFMNLLPTLYFIELRFF